MPKEKGMLRSSMVRWKYVGMKKWMDGQRVGNDGLG